MFCLENIIVFFNSTKKLIWNFLSFTSANMHGIRNILVSGITLLRLSQYGCSDTALPACLVSSLGCLWELDVTASPEYTTWHITPRNMTHEAFKWNLPPRKQINNF